MNNSRIRFRNTRSRFFNKQLSWNEEDEHSTGSVENTGNYWKDKGNEAYRQGKYDTAIEFYTKAIEMNEGESQYYSNRAKCHQKKGEYRLALRDAESACELSDQSIKAHYICGCILGEMGKQDASKLKKAENRLRKALRLCDTLKSPKFEQQIEIKFLRLKKLIWHKERQSDLMAIKLTRQSIEAQKKRGQINENDSKLVISNLQSREQALTRQREIPDHLTCKITLQLMEEPVISQAGLTYERQALEEHFRLKGPVQPITRQECKGLIIPNQACKQAVELFLEQNPWAFEHAADEQYHLIPMV